MTGVLWAAASGIGFGLFQSVNIRAVRALEDAYLSTFIQVTVAAIVLSLAAAIAGELTRLGDLSALGFVIFAAAGLLHFLAGWTCLNLSQERIGAARTAPLLTTVPIWGTAIAAATLGELPSAGTLAGVAVIVAGALIVARPGRGAASSGRDSAFGLATAFFWALSPILTVRGLRELDSPLLGVTLGVVVSAVAYAALLSVRRRSHGPRRRAPASAVALKAVAGAIVALATWTRWLALDEATVGAVLGLSLLAVPVVLTVTSLRGGRDSERVDARVLIGAGLVIAGSLVLIAVE